MNLIYSTPLFGVAATVIAYSIGTGAHRRWRWAHGLVVTCGLLIAMILLGHVPYADYKVGGDLVAFFLGPATVALGVPLYKRAREIQQHLKAVILSVIAGAAVGIISAVLLVKLAGGSRTVMLSMAPKSVTTPISMEVSRMIGGTPELTAVLTVLAGLIGSVIGPWVLKCVGVKDDISVGVAMGTSSHGIGTARLVRESELAGGVAGLSMALAGIVTSLMAVGIKWWVK
ncbi:MAG TPA: LrgB family protein [Tepidisphaeraceae bacterium]|jgi:predicted murein hydrolase (TIGR00659 family)|nr:LrgB family protein [Tepidisphaeraceae bacterium]